jgi:hypothetical protein
MTKDEVDTLIATARKNVKLSRELTVVELIVLLQRFPAEAKVGCTAAADCSLTGVYGLHFFDEEACSVTLQGW